MPSVLSASVAVILTVYGNGCTIVALNWWLNTFPSDAGATFSVQLATSIFYCLCFLVCILVMAARYGPQALWHSFAKPPSSTKTNGVTDSSTGRRMLLRRFKLLVLMGLSDVGSNLIAVYATPHTPEILQAFLYTTIAPWALLQSYFFVAEERLKSYRSKVLWISITLIIFGVIISAIPFNNLTDIHIKKKFTQNIGSFVGWILVYASSAVVYAAWTVLQRIYCDEAYLGEGDVTTTTSSSGDDDERRSLLQSHGTVSVNQNDDDDDDETMESGKIVNRDVVPWETLNKFVMLFGDSVFQLIFTLALLPTDAIPWLGGSSSVGDTWVRLVRGIHFLVSSRSAVLFGLLYSTAYFLSYIGGAILNHYNPTLSCMFVQLSAPLTALILIIVPSWNVNSGGKVLWYQQAISMVAITASAFLFRHWLVKHEATTPSVEDPLHSSEESSPTKEGNK